MQAANKLTGKLSHVLNVKFYLRTIQDEYHSLVNNRKQCVMQKYVINRLFTDSTIDYILIEVDMLAADTGKQLTHTRHVNCKTVWRCFQSKSPHLFTETTHTHTPPSLPKPSHSNTHRVCLCKIVEFSSNFYSLTFTFISQYSVRLFILSSCAMSTQRNSWLVCNFKMLKAHLKKDSNQKYKKHITVHPSIIYTDCPLRVHVYRRSIAGQTQRQIPIHFHNSLWSIQSSQMT